MAHHFTPLRRPAESLEQLVQSYLAADGLSFRVSAAPEPYDYRFAIGTDAADLLVGGAERDFLWGLGGDDRLAGLAENDVAYGGAGADLLTGGDGGDRLRGGDGDDQAWGGDANDGLGGGAGDDFLDEGAGHGDLDGGMGDDVLVGGPGADAFMVHAHMNGDDVVRDFTAGPGMFDHLALHMLRWEDLTIEDTADGVRIAWAGGSVLLEGVARADLAQDDFMFADAPDLPPGARAPDGPTAERDSPSTDGPVFDDAPLPGADFLTAARPVLRGDPIDFTFGDDRIAVGTRRGDTLAGDHADHAGHEHHHDGGIRDHIVGLGGGDHIAGHDGDDVLEGDAGDDTIHGGDGGDRVDGGSGDDVLDGGEMADEVMGGDGADTIDAGAGHDMIEGGPGDDTIRGGTGADAFIVDPHSGFDRVLDFEATGLAQGAFDHIALMELLPSQISVEQTDAGAQVLWNVDDDPEAEGGVLLEGVAVADLRQSDFMFNEAPGFVAGISDVGSYYIFA